MDRYLVVTKNWPGPYVFECEAFIMNSSTVCTSASDNLFFCSRGGFVGANGHSLHGTTVRAGANDRPSHQLVVCGGSWR